MKCIATLLRFDIFYILNNVSEAFFLEKGYNYSEYDISSVFWSVSQIFQVLDDFLKVRIDLIRVLIVNILINLNCRLIRTI
jgi:hypothetical protein